MFKWLAGSRFRRFVLGLVLVTYLPVVSATVACQIACALQMGPHSSARGFGHAAAKPTAAEETSHLAHTGPCNLASVPAVCAPDFRLIDHRTALRLELPADTHPASYVGAPPEHKPRT